MTDADIRWVPGDGWGVVTPRVLVWMDAAAGLQAALAIHRAASEGATVDALLTEMSRRDCTSYAIAFLGSNVAVAACGGGGVEALGPSGPVTCGSSTGSGEKRTLAGPLRRAVVGLIAPFEDALPITSGVVPCSALVAGRVEIPVATPQPATSAVERPEPADVSTEVNPFAELWGHTVHRPVEAAAVRGLRRDGESGSPRSSLPPVSGPAASAPVQAPVVVRSNAASFEDGGPAAVRLPGGVGRGRVSDVTLIPESEKFGEEAGPDVFGALVGPGEVRIEIHGPVVVGRAPISLDPSGQVFKVESPQREVSRSHVLIRPDDDQLVALDLSSNNGTTLLRPGRRAEAVSSAVPTPLLEGDVLDLGDGVSIRLEGPA